MPCNHKFQNELHLELVDYEPTTLIVGSFNPDLGDKNTAAWFYGRTAESCFWDVLPRLYGEPSLIDANPEQWKQFCRDKRIALTDIISCIEDAELTNKAHSRALAGFTDKAIEYNFDDFGFVNIAKLLQSRPTIKNVYLTRGITEPFWRHLWNPVVQYCNRNGMHERRLLTPTHDADYHHEAYNHDHPANKIPKLEDYILMRWQEEWRA